MLSHCLLMAVSTLTAARFNSERHHSTCSSDSLCIAVNPAVTPLHVIFPVAVCLACFVVIHMPVVLLGSATQMRRIQDSTVQLILLGLVILFQLCAVRASPALVTTVSTHAVVFLLTKGDLQCSVLEWSARLSTLCVLLAWVWDQGVPLPIFPAPGVSVCCGAVTHLAGISSSALLIPVFRQLLTRFLVTTPTAFLTT